MNAVVSRLRAPARKEKEKKRAHTPYHDHIDSLRWWYKRKTTRERSSQCPVGEFGRRFRFQWARDMRASIWLTSIDGNLKLEIERFDKKKKQTFMRSERQEHNKFGIHEYIRHIKARFVKKPEHRGKVAPGMQDLAQEVSTQGAKGVRRNSSNERQDARNEMTTYPNITVDVPKSAVESSRVEARRQSYPRHAYVPVVPWASSPTVRGSAWGGFEDAMAKWSYTETRLSTVSTCDTIGRTPVRPDRERAPVWVTDRRMGRWQGLEGGTASITGVESSVEVCEWMSGGYGKVREKNGRTA
ncbi:hypothetical protein DFH06DRAFT_1409759 [Mycena polygramma]|nr:hypothetical protein DFH06DRAFT_1409759 [Mycena polygramma]